MMRKTLLKIKMTMMMAVMRRKRKKKTLLKVKMAMTMKRALLVMRMKNMM
jgi:hypothetical protein